MTNSVIHNSAFHIPYSAFTVNSVLHLAAGCWQQGGGLSEAVASLAVEQARQGNAVGVAFLDNHVPHVRLEEGKRFGLQTFIFRHWGPKHLYFSWQMVRHLRELIAQTKRLHLHGGWSFPLLWGAHCARRCGVPMVWSTHGSVSPIVFRRHPILRWVAWHLFFKRALCSATLLHASSQKEADDLKCCLDAQCPPIKVVPEGIDTRLFDSVPEQPREKVVLFMGRLHPLKGLDLLTRAWQKSGLAHQGWQCHIAGPLDGALPPEGEEIHTLGLLEGEGRVKAIKSAGMVVLPSRSENFGIIVAEALYCKTPVIATQATPWEILGEAWIPVDDDALTEAMLRLARLPFEMRAERFSKAFAYTQTLTWDSTARALMQD